MKTKDDFQSHYNISNCFAKATSFAFLVLIVPDNIKRFLLLIQIFCALSYVMLNVIDNCLLWYEAEIGRIKDNIADAFSVSLTEERTEGYYSNKEVPSIKKYAVNTYESAFYSREESVAMRPYAIAKIIIAIGIVLLLSMVGTVDKALILLVTQTMFSSVVIVDCIQLIVFSFKMKGICEKFYTQLITENGIVTADRDAILLSCIVEYESTKMYFKVRLSQKVFEKLKPKLETDWEKLLLQIK